jgi:hypothetical protein
MSEVTDAVGSIVGAAASGPIGIIGALLGKAMDFIPDPAKKLEFQQHAMDLQAQLQEQQLDALTKQIAASAPANSDHYMGAVRGWFGFVMIALYAWNYGIGPAFHAVTVQMPMQVTVMFSVLLLGFVGVPAGIEMAKQIAVLPGDSSVKLFGMSVGNKS